MGLQPQHFFFFFEFKCILFLNNLHVMIFFSLKNNASTPNKSTFKTNEELKMTSVSFV